MGKNEKVYKYIFWGIIIITFFSIMINSSTRDFFVKLWTLHDLKIKKEKMINENRKLEKNIERFNNKQREVERALKLGAGTNKYGVIAEDEVVYVFEYDVEQDAEK